MDFRTETRGGFFKPEIDLIMYGLYGFKNPPLRTRHFRSYKTAILIHSAKKSAFFFNTSSY